MQLSASALKKFTKCGESYRLQKEEGFQEPGPMSYGALHGKIVGRALALGSEFLQEYKEIPDAQIAALLVEAFEMEFQAAQMPTDIIDGVRELLVRGLSPAIMNELDNLSISLNTEKYYFKVPPPLKDTGKTKGGYSADKKRFGMIVLKAIEDLQWFFSSDNDVYHDIRDALFLDHELPFSKVISPELTIRGFFDQRIVTKEEREIVSEWKTDKSPYSLDFSGRMIQLVTYRIGASETASVRLYDVSHQQMFEPRFTDEMLAATLQRYRVMEMTTRFGLYTPACGTDPYSDSTILCGFKCIDSPCQFGGVGK